MQRFTPWLRTLFTALALLFAVAAPAQEAREATTEIPETWQARELPANWVTIDTPAFEIVGHVDHTRLMDRLAAHGRKSLTKLADDIGVPIGGTIRVYITDDQSVFEKLQPGETPFWADGTAWPTLGVIFLRHPIIRGNTDKPLEQVLDHELIHVLLGRAFAPQPTPHWLQEGVAQVYSGEVGLDLPNRISKGLVGRSPWTLAELTDGFPSDPHGAALAYAQSADFILWLRSEWGQEAVRTLIQDCIRGRPIKHALASLTDVEFETLNTMWTSRLAANNPIMSNPANIEMLLWGFGGLLLMGGGISRRRAFRKRMANWHEEEQGIERLAAALLRRRRG